MGRLGDAMRDFWEGIGGFLSLGGRDLSNKCAILAHGVSVRSMEKQMSARLVELGRKAWTAGIPVSESLPVFDKLKGLEGAIGGKEEAATEVRGKIKELQDRRQEHLTHYQKKISEQLELKRPVDSEKTGLLAEVKRLRREYTATQKEIDLLAGKIELQSRRLKELKVTGGDQSEGYMREEIRQEIEFNERTGALKKEKISFLQNRLEEHSKRAEKVGTVVEQYERQITELRKSQKEGAEKFDEQLRQLHDSLRQIEGDIRRIRREMRPLFGELGLELQKRPFSGAGLEKIYSDIADLSREKEEHLVEIAKRRADSASIGLGIKLGFYGLILGLLVLLVVLFFLLL